MAVVNELITKFTYQGTTEPINNFTDGLKGAFSILGVVSTAIAATAGVFAIAATKAADIGDALGDLSQRTGVAVEAIQKLNYAAIMNGSSQDAMSSSLEGLNRQIGMAANGEKMQSDLFKEMGISIKDTEGKVKSADIVFAEMQKTLSGKSPQEIAGYLRKLRLDPTLAQTLGLTAEEMAKLNSEAEGFGIMSQEQIDQAQAFNDSLDRLKFGMSAMQNQMGLGLLPAMTEGIEIFTEFLKANKDLISNGISQVVNFISGAFHILRSFWQIIDGLISNTIGWGGALGLLAGAVLYLNRAMLLNPAVWIAAAFVGLMLIVDDLVTAFNGGESAIATFFDEMFGIDIVNTMIDGFNLLKQIVAMLISPFLLLADVVVNVIRLTADLFNMLGADIKTPFLDSATKKLGELRKANLEVALGTGGMTAPRPAMSGSTANTTQNNQVTVNVTGASDPQRTADLTSKAVQREVRAAKVNGTRGGQ